MPIDRVSEIQIEEKPEETITVLKRSGVEKKEYKTRTLERLIRYFDVRFKNKKYQMSDIYQITCEGDEYMDYVKIEGTFINFQNSIGLIYHFMKDFGAQQFPWVLIDYATREPIEFDTLKQFQNYLSVFWKKREPLAVSQDKSTLLFKHPSEIKVNNRIKNKWR